MRKQRRIAGMITTVPSTILAGVTSGSYFLTQEIDPTSSPIAGIDPVYVYALLTLGCTGAYASDAYYRPLVVAYSSITLHSSQALDTC